MLLRRQPLLQEGVRTGDFTVNRASAITGGFQLTAPDYVAKLEQWRKSCSNYHDLSHGSWCDRCDAVWQLPTGGVKWSAPAVTSQPNNIFAESREGNPASMTKSAKTQQFRRKRQAEICNSPTNWVNIPSNIFASDDNRSKIKDLPVQESNVREGTNMNDYVRDLLRMSGGGALGGRDRVNIPDELMDAMAGDAAQEAILKDRVLEEMRRQATPEDSGGKYVGLDLMVESMSKGDVDKFLNKARGKIIKRSKSTRKSCCAKIGGILDQIMGPAGGEFADAQAAKDRGDAEPIGEALSDDHKKLYAFRKGESRDARAARIAHHKKTGKHLDEEALLDFIAEEFDLNDHNSDCAFRATLARGLAESDASTARALSLFSEGSHTGSAGSLKKPCYSDKATTRPDNKEYSTDLRSLAAGSKHSAGALKSAKGMGGGRFDKDADPIGDDVDYDEPQISETASALSGFMEASHTGSVGSLKRQLYFDAKTTRADNSDYPTELSSVKSGSKVAGGLKSLKNTGSHKPRFDKDADPIGEEDYDDHYDGPQISETASALSGFMEASHTGSAGNMSMTPYWGPKQTRDDNKQGFLKTRLSAAKSERGKGEFDPANPGERKSRFDKDADPRGGATNSQLY